MLSGLPMFTLVHVYVSLIGIASGLVVACGLLAAKRMNGWTALFLASTAASVVTGFLLPAHRLLPSHVFGILTTIALALAIYARYSRNFAGAWRVTYVVSAMIALYLNVFILNRPALRERDGVGDAGADTERAAVQSDAARRPGAFFRVDHRRGNSVPAGGLAFEFAGGALLYSVF